MKLRNFLAFALCFLLSARSLSAQSTTATIQGLAIDEQKALVPGVAITARNLETNATRSAVSNDEGRYRIANLPVGIYEVSAELSGFAKYVQSGITLALNQNAVVDVTMRPAGIQQTVNVEADAPALNTTSAEVGVLFDRKRISELPLATDRDIFAIALSAPGVSQLGSGQANFASGVEKDNFSVNGMRVRSNNFMIDGQDSNDPSVTGRQQSVNNPDIVQEVRLITNQFAAEYGRAAGSVMNVITKSGTNDFHGSAFWFHNDNALNSRNNQDEKIRPKAPFRIENQFGGTAGGPIVRDRTFFFGSYQRWTDRRLGTGTTLDGAPTEAGRQILQQAAGSRPQVAALLKFLPAAQTPLGRTVPFTLGGQSYQVPIGSLTGSAGRAINNDQFMARIDQRLSDKHTLNGRYLFTDQTDQGDGQVTPAGLTTIVPQRQQAANIWLTSALSNRIVNEVRGAYQRYATQTSAQDTTSQEIPSIEISELGLTGFNAGTARTAIGLAVNLPSFRFSNTYQLQENFSYTAGSHALKFGTDFRRIDLKSFFVPTTRGRLSYSTLQRFVDDAADLAATINKPLPGGQTIVYYKWYDMFFFGQDEWRVTNNFTLNLGLRYEVPGNSINSLVDLNKQIVQTAGGDQRFALTPVPKRDVNNLQPRFGFNWNPSTRTTGPLGRLTGGNKLVLRGGYSRTNDYGFININLNIASAFPFIYSLALPTTAQPGGGLAANNAFSSLAGVQASGDPNMITRTIVGSDWRSPAADQYSLEIQRELTTNFVFRVGYVGTHGTSLFQTLDGNPRLPLSTQRVDPTRGIIRLRANAANSIYHSLQVSGEKRLSNAFSAGVHYTWSAFIDTASEVFNPSSGEVAVSQDSFNRAADRGRSSYDRPHRLTGNFVYELPFFRNPQGALQHVIGGWQLNSFFTFQSGAPFTVLNGADPTGALNGIDGLVGNAIRPNQNTTLDTSRMSVEELRNAGGRSLYSILPAGVRAGDVGRNTIRADGIGNVDLGFIKNTRIKESQNIQFRAEMYNATNTRNFGIPEGRVNSSNFLNQWGTDGGNRRIILALRYTF
ncbi:MAG TPA: carboxypeptidase regulatory-like domain-containing protein [Terriglobia bacterium]|nr:carboxypeptidase regulatory-like domain-containing protein [Terriglobia bacterium]